MSGPNGLVRISHGFRALMRRVEWRGRAARSDALVCGVSLGHGGGEGWIRGRDSVRGLGPRVDDHGQGWTLLTLLTALTLWTRVAWSDAPGCLVWSDRRETDGR
jgi:hypothetical protein